MDTIDIKENCGYLGGVISSHNNWWKQTHVWSFGSCIRGFVWIRITFWRRWENNIYEKLISMSRVITEKYSVAWEGLFNIFNLMCDWLLAKYWVWNKVKDENPHQESYMKNEELSFEPTK